MKLRPLMLLATVAVLAILAAVWVSRSRAPDASALSPGPLAPGLAQTLDQVTQVRIVGAGDATLVTLDRIVPIPKSCARCCRPSPQRAASRPRPRSPSATRSSAWKT